MISGILNVNKPAGVTSFSIVSLVRELLGERRVGHAGTLDPIADGVLPICIGQATRVVEFLISQPKAYRTAIRLGSATDTYDSEGRVTATADPTGVSRTDVESALQGFVGEIQQLPPMYSALKHQGKPLYRYARAGKTVPREPRPVRVYRMELKGFEQGLVDLELEVGQGMYVRTLAYDLGELLGCHAHMEHLTRLASGPFSLEDARTPDELRLAAESETLEDWLYPIDRVVESWHAALLGKAHEMDVSSGRLLVLKPAVPALLNLATGTPCRAYSATGEFLAILRYRGSGHWHPEKVFATR